MAEQKEISASKKTFFGDRRISSILQGLYGISESETMMPKESARFTLNRTIHCLEVVLLQAEQTEAELRTSIINEFVNRAWRELGAEDEDSYARESIIKIAEQMKSELADKNEILRVEEIKENERDI